MENGFAYLYNDKQSKALHFSLHVNEIWNSKIYRPARDYRIVNEHNIDNKNITGIVPLTIGFKLSLLKEKGIMPLTALLAHLSFPTTCKRKI